MADRLAQFHTPVTIRFLVLREAKGLAYLPPELAEVGDRPLARRDLSLVFKIAGSETMERLFGQVPGRGRSYGESEERRRGVVGDAPELRLILAALGPLPQMESGLPERP